MEKKKECDAKKLVIRTTLAVLTVAVSLVLTGCGKRMARIEQNPIPEPRSPIPDKHLEDSQSQLHVTIEDVQEDAKKKAADIIAAIEQEQIALQNILQIHNQQLTKSIVGIEED